MIKKTVPKQPIGVCLRRIQRLLGVRGRFRVRFRAMAGVKATWSSMFNHPDGARNKIDDQFDSVFLSTMFNHPDGARNKIHHQFDSVFLCSR